MWVLFVMNIFSNTCVFGAHLCDLQSTLRNEEIRSAWKNSDFSFVPLVLPLFLSDRITTFYQDAASAVVCSNVRIISEILWDQSFVLSEIVNCVHSIIGDCVVWKYQRNQSTGFIRKPGHGSVSRTRRNRNLQRFKKAYATNAIQTISLWGLCLSDRKISIYY